MNHERKKIRSAVRSENAQNDILTSLVSFAVTVIVTRVSQSIDDGNLQVRLVH
jgi:hypothetical protein